MRSPRKPSITRRRFCGLLTAAPLTLAAPPPDTAATLYAQGTRQLLRGTLFERAMGFLTRAAAMDPTNPAPYLALGCACASRAASLAYAAAYPHSLKLAREHFEESVKTWERQREEFRREYPKEADTAFGEETRPKLPPARVFPTKDDNRPFRLTRAQTEKRLAELSTEAQAAWEKGVALSRMPADRANASYIKGWGLRLLRDYLAPGTHGLTLQDYNRDDEGKGTPPFTPPKLPPYDAVLAAFDKAIEADGENPLYRQAKADALEQADDRKGALAAYQEAAERTPRSAAMLWYRLYNLAATGGYENPEQTWSMAQTFLKKAQTQDTANAWPLYEEAGILFRHAPYGLTGASGPRNAPESVMEPLRAAVRNDKSRETGRRAIDRLIAGNSAPVYAPPLYRESVPDLLAAAWRYAHPDGLDFSGWARARELARSACSYAQFLAEFENNSREAERAGQASIAMGKRIIGDWPLKEDPAAGITIVPSLVGIAVTMISYRMLLKTYETLGEGKKAVSLQTEMDAFDRTAKAYQEATRPLLNREDYADY